jgi:hypothetical protein
MFLSVIAILCFACNSFRQLEGTYCIVQKSVSPDNTTLVLKSDNTFNGKSWSDIAGSFSVSGTWLKSNDTLYLKAKQPRLIDTIIYSQKINSSSYLNVQIVDIERKKPLEGVYIFDGNKSYQSNEEGNVTISSVQGDFLAIEYMGIRDSISSRKIYKGEIKVFFNFKNLQTFSMSQKWLIKKNNIIPIEKGFSVFRKCH